MIAAAQCALISLLSYGASVNDFVQWHSREIYGVFGDSDCEFFDFLRRGNREGGPAAAGYVNYVSGSVRGIAPLVEIVSAHKNEGYNDTAGIGHPNVLRSASCLSFPFYLLIRENGSPELKSDFRSWNNMRGTKSIESIFKANDIVPAIYDGVDINLQSRRSANVRHLDSDVYVCACRVYKQVPASLYLNIDPRPLLGDKKLAADLVGFNGSVSGIFGYSHRAPSLAPLLSDADERDNPKPKGRDSQSACKDIEPEGIEDESPLRLIAVLLGPLLGVIFLFLIGVIPTETNRDYRKRQNAYRPKNDVPRRPPNLD